MTDIEFVERVERGVEGWMREGLSPAAALTAAYARAVLDMEAAGALPTGYFRCRLHDRESDELHNRGARDVGH